MKKQYAKTAFTTNAAGICIAHVPLYGSNQHATLYAEDLQRILADGWSPRWSIASTGGRNKYVLVNAPKPGRRNRSLTVARLIAQVGKGQIVKYADGDHTNLSRENLLVSKGTAWVSLDALRPRLREVDEGHTSDHMPPPLRVLQAINHAAPCARASEQDGLTGP